MSPDSRPLIDPGRILRETFVRHVDVHRETTSTNDVAVQWAMSSRLAAPTLVLAERQTAGRGRGAHRWWSGPGALTASLVLEPRKCELLLERWPRISLATAVAVYDVIAERAPGARLGIKWPNDVQCDGRKICGILVEVPNISARLPRRVVMGIGLNVNNSWRHAPSELADSGTSLCDVTGAEHNLEDVLVALISRLERRLEQLATLDPALPEAWRTLCVLRERRIEVEIGPRTIQGVCAGIDGDGALLVGTDKGVERVFGGIVKPLA